MPATKLDAALELAAYGFPVFPLIPNDKRPLFKGWQSKATSDQSTIRTWWQSEPEANIGVLTDRLLVVDLDPRNGSAATMQELRMMYPDPPDSLASVTAGGGAHLIFALPDSVEVRGGTGLLGPGVDVKSHGGYIVAPGSTIDGRMYKWVRSPADTKLAEPPQWMLAKCERPAERSALAGHRVAEEDDEAIARAEYWLSKNAPEAVEGERDNTAFKVAAKLYDFGLQPATCREYLTQWNEGWCHPPLDSDAIERLVASAATNRQTAIGSKSPNAGGFEAIEIDERDAPSPPNSEGPNRGLYVLSYGDAASKALTDTSEPLIEGLLDREAMSVWYGESNSGKTFVMLDAAWHIAAGRPWADRPSKQGAVVYVAAEGGKGILKRVRALKERYPDAGEVPLYIVPCPVDLLHKDADLKPLVALIRGLGAATELVVIDTLSRAIAGGNENDSTDMGVFVAHLDAIRRATSAHVAVVHHTGKDKAKGARGHSLLRAATDTEIEIDRRTVTVTKQRDMEGDLKLYFHLKPVRLGVARGKDVTSCTVDMSATNATLQQRIALTSVEQQTYDILLATWQNLDEHDKTLPFDWELLSKNEWTKGFSRTTANRHLSNLSEKGWLKKVYGNQYVMGDVQNVQSDHSLMG